MSSRNKLCKAAQQARILPASWRGALAAPSWATTLQLNTPWPPCLPASVRRCRAAAGAVGGGLSHPRAAVRSRGLWLRPGPPQLCCPGHRRLWQRGGWRRRSPRGSCARCAALGACAQHAACRGLRAPLWGHPHLIPRTAFNFKAPIFPPLPRPARAQPCPPRPTPAVACRRRACASSSLSLSSRAAVRWTGRSRSRTSDLSRSSARAPSARWVVGCYVDVMILSRWKSWHEGRPSISIKVMRKSAIIQVSYCVWQPWGGTLKGPSRLAPS